MSNEEDKESIKNNIYELIFLSMELMKVSYQDCMLMPINVLRNMVKWKIDIQNKQLEEMNKNSETNNIKGKTIHLR